MKKTIGYVLSHTHWDREWYLSFQLFRMRLVDMLDTLIPCLEQHPEFPHFHLDGQTVCLEDYLEVRPDQAERLRHLIEAGRIAVGPWYVLPDLQCIGQEGYYITNGKAIPITWTKTSDTERTVYRDLNGDEITINTGKTYIGFVADDVWSELVVE